MKRIVLALFALFGTVASASAACTGPAVMHDFPGTAFNMSLATVPDGNCGSNIAIPTWAGGTLGAMANYGTSPGAVLVPGVNAFMTNPIPAGTNLMGKVGIDQTTPGTTNLVAAGQNGTWTVQPGNTPNTTAWLFNMGAMGGTNISSSCVQNYGTAPSSVACPSVNAFVTNSVAAVKGSSPVLNGANTYNTVAASQTAQILSSTQGGGTGTTGDYLSHCVIQPTTTAAGTVTIADNSTTVFLFTTGTLSNLAPISIPVGALSTSGGWKITTGANETVTCVGKFT